MNMNEAIAVEATSIAAADEPAILEEIEIEDLAVDGICGVY